MCDTVPLWLGSIEASDEKLETSRKKIESYFLFNSQEEGEERYKLLLTQSDRETFIRLIEGRELPQVASKRIVENYEYFETGGKSLQIL